MWYTIFAPPGISMHMWDKQKTPEDGSIEFKRRYVQPKKCFITLRKESKRKLGDMHENG